MAHVLVPSLPPKSDYGSFEQRPCTHDRRASGEGQTCAGDKSGSNELMHALQNAFESNWSGPCSTNTRPRATKKPAKEIVVVVDDEDEEEGEKAAKASLPTSLNQALATAFSLDSSNLHLAAKTSTSAQARGPTVANGSTRRLRRETRAESSSESASMEVDITSPTKRPHTHVRTQAVSNRICDAACIAAQEGGTTPYIFTDD